MGTKKNAKNTEEENIKYEVRRSSRKTVAVEIRRDASVLVRAPQLMTDREIEKFVREHADWIREHRKQMRQHIEETEPAGRLTPEQIRDLAEQAAVVIPERVRSYAPLVGVTYGRITIRNQRTRWGSCSAKGNLNFNCLLMLMPPQILDYVVVHELAHRKEMNHSPAFWSIVEEVLPDYRKRRSWLKSEGDRYMRMMPGQDT